MARFFGQYEHSIDPKGRLILPSKFRPPFEMEGAGGFLTQQAEGCIALWTADEFESRMEDMLRLSREGASERNLVRVWSSTSAQVELDRQGRMALPGRLREFAGLELDGPVLVAGIVDRVELWNPQRWEERVAPEEQRLLEGGVIV